MAIPALIATAVVGAMQYKSNKKAADESASRNQAAIADMKSSQADAANKAKENIKKKVSAMSRTVYTSPLGLSGEAAVAKKQLLGQ